MTHPVIVVAADKPGACRGFCRDLFGFKVVFRGELFRLLGATRDSARGIAFMALTTDIMALWPWSKPKADPDPAAAARDLREAALRHRAQDLGIAPAPELPRVFGILMETGYDQAVASLVVFAEGSASLYFSTGGGVIGAGEHESVAEAMVPFFLTAEEHLGAFSRTAQTPYPAPGRVRFYVRTYDGTLTAEASEDDLGNMRHELSNLFHAGHGVISAVREVSGG